MCGIAGYVSKEKINDSSVISEMISTITHRGPDDSGYSLFSNDEKNVDIALGFRRLSIIDTSINGHQPMQDATGNICICFNGEFYNAEEYRKELVLKGYKFHGKSDTEILLNLYIEYGIDELLKKINGMFAICIVDRRKGCLYLIRDRLGIKPLYYYSAVNTILFASEIKSFYAHPSFENVLNYAALDEYLMFRYIAGKNTLLKAVYSILPGHYLTIDSNLNIADHTYWDFASNAGKQQLKLEELEQLIFESVEKRLVSDVRLGVQLSGGIDSSVVMYEASKLKSQIDSFSVILDNEELSEKKWMDIAADKCGVIQHQYLWEKEGFGDLIKKMTWHLDMPLNHPNTLGIYLLSCYAKKEGVSVLLSGEGADELLGGYRRYVRFLWSKNNPSLAEEEDRKKGISRLWKEEHLKFITSSSYGNIDIIKRIFPDFNADRALANREKIFSGIPGEYGEMDRYLNYDMRTYLVSLLERQDKMSMAASIENRVPFLDHTLVECVRGTASNNYILPDKEGNICFSKIPLKKISEGIFGPKFTYRPKSGFTIPLNDFLVEKQFQEELKNVYEPFLKKLDMFIGIDSIFNAFDKKTPWEIENGAWQLLTFAIWGSIFLGSKEKVIRFER